MGITRPIVEFAKEIATNLGHHLGLLLLKTCTSNEYRQIPTHKKWFAYLCADQKIALGFSLCPISGPKRGPNETQTSVLVTCVSISKLKQTGLMVGLYSHGVWRSRAIRLSYEHRSMDSLEIFSGRRQNLDVKLAIFFQVPVP